MFRSAPEKIRSDPRVARVWAEALWRNERGEEAVTVLQIALEGKPADRDRRRLEVLRSDILFASGDPGAACDGYRTAREIAATPWVEEQLERCDSRRQETKS
jgi:hypothetical protein